MPLPISGALSTNSIADEIGYTQSFLHSLAGPLKSGNAPGTFSLTYMFRPGNVRSYLNLNNNQSYSGVTQTAPFGMSAFHGQEAIYKCVSFTASNGITGSAEIVIYYKNTITATFSGTQSYCIRQKWDGSMDIKNLINATYSLGLTCAIGTGGGTTSTNTNYTKHGIRIYAVGGYGLTGGTTSALAAAYNTANAFGGTFANTWWANPSSNTTDGRQNRAGFWNAAGVPFATASIINYSAADDGIGNGFISFPMTATQTRTYYLGVGSDNGAKVDVDNVLIFSYSNFSDTINFNYWHIYPITFSSGYHIISVYNHNLQSQGSLAAELYGNTFSSLINILDSATASGITPSNIDIIYTTKDHITSGSFYQSYGLTCSTGLDFTGTISLTGSGGFTSSGYATFSIQSGYINVSYDSVKVNGITVSGVSFPIAGNGAGNGTSSQVGGTQSVDISYTLGFSIGSRYIKLTDSINFDKCWTLSSGSFTISTTASIFADTTIYIISGTGTAPC